MKTFTYKCITIEYFCDQNGINYNEAMNAICSSDVSFGNNYDTLVDIDQLKSILEDYDIPVDNIVHNNKGILISLGS